MAVMCLFGALLGEISDVMSLFLTHDGDVYMHYLRQMPSDLEYYVMTNHPSTV